MQIVLMAEPSASDRQTVLSGLLAFIHTEVGVVGTPLAEAVRRGCIGAHLDTYDYQAPDFYRKLGYEVFGSIDDHPPGHTRFWMRKRFVESGATKMASRATVG